MQTFTRNPANLKCQHERQHVFSLPSSKMNCAWNGRAQRQPVPQANNAGSLGCNTANAHEPGGRAHLTRLQGNKPHYCKACLQGGKPVVGTALEYAPKDRLK
eukprot:1680203-Heterocapsa_arctica.AAC.1